jgi:sec-independent protein translocase protein TatA
LTPVAAYSDKNSESEQDFMFGLGWPEVVIICVVAIVIFGPKKIPELGSSFGKTLRSFRDGMTQSAEDGNSEDELD